MIPRLQLKPRQSLLLLAISLLLGLASLTVAQTEILEITWWTVAGGGETFSSGGEYALGGTAGQVAAGEPLSGGPYTSQGGFWVIPAQTSTPSPTPTAVATLTPTTTPTPTPPAELENTVYLPVVVAP